VAADAETETLGPITRLERVELIDAVRGFALFGVLLANMVWLSQDIVLTPERLAALPTAGIDAIAKHAVVFFIDWKFITLFSFLFGLGFAVQLMRAEERGRPVLGVYTRRLLILLLFGVVHAFVLWYGDILHFYALLGFVLILCRNASDRVLIIAGLFFAVVFPAVAQYVVTLQPPPPPTPGAPPSSELWLDTFLSGDLPRVARGNLNFLITRFWASHAWTFILGQVFGKFLFGYYAGRKRLLQDASEHLDLYRKLLCWGLVVGVVCNGVWVLTDVLIQQKQLEPQSGWMLPARFLIYIGTIALAAFYLSAIVLLYQRPSWQKRICLLAPVGRMALTNYVMQTVFNLLIFYGYGLGLLGKVGTAFCILLSLVIFTAQIAYSNWWLKIFRFGPAEWLWRSLTYGKLQSMR
jgi:uncharacterized protein